MNDSSSGLVPSDFDSFAGSSVQSQFRYVWRTPDRGVILNLVEQLNSSDSAVARQAAALLDKLLYLRLELPWGSVIHFDTYSRFELQHRENLRIYRVLDPILQALEHGTVFARQHAAGIISSQRDSRAIPALLRCLKDPSPVLRQKAAHSLYYFPGPQTTQPLIDALFDPEISVVTSSAWTLGSYMAADAVSALMILTTHHQQRIRCAAMHALGQIGDQIALPFLRNALKDKSKRVRKAAKSALGSFDLTRRGVMVHACASIYPI